MNEFSLPSSSTPSYDSNGSFGAYFLFLNDTIFTSTNNIMYVPESYFHFDGTIMNIADLTGAMCPISDTGQYYPNVYNDTMVFTYFAMISSAVCADAQTLEMVNRAITKRTLRIITLLRFSSKTAVMS